jgi:enoyl-CoA hydratase/carnithine racemase
MDAYRKAASRLSPKLSPSALAQLGNSMEQALTGAPSSVYSIPESVRFDPFVLTNKSGTSSHPFEEETGTNVRSNPGAVIRSIGNSRRVFLLNSSLSPVELDGLSYRIRALASNDAINSIVVANPLEDAASNCDMSENTTCLSSFMEEGESPSRSVGAPWGKHLSDSMKTLLHENYGEGLAMPIVSSGYDARSIYDAGMHKHLDQLERELMVPLISLSKAVRGSYDETINSSPSKVPLITIPHGLTADAGYSLLLGSYVLATHSTILKILNPLRGLAFDPVGLSYLLPRLGWEFSQTSREYSKACGVLLALTGYEANAEDMVATGLATHYIGSPYKLNILERGLSELNSFAGQALRAKPKTLHGHQHNDAYDVNGDFRNVAVGNLIQHISEYDAAGADEYGCYLRDDLDEETGLFLKDKDPSITLPEERIQMYGEVFSAFVSWGATFQEALLEPTVEGIIARLEEIAATKAEFEGKSGCEEDVMVAEQAEYLVSNMKQRSPLALRTMHRLLQKGSEENETLETCMEREKTSQMRLFAKEDGDFVRWAESGKGVGLVGMKGVASPIKEKEDIFSNWNHASVKEVTNDEVEELLSGA